jgi:hypothetical protein
MNVNMKELWKIESLLVRMNEERSNWWIKGCISAIKCGYK